MKLSVKVDHKWPGGLEGRSCNYSSEIPIAFFLKSRRAFSTPGKEKNQGVIGMISHMVVMSAQPSLFVLYLHSIEHRAILSRDAALRSGDGFESEAPPISTILKTSIFKANLNGSQIVVKNSLQARRKGERTEARMRECEISTGPRSSNAVSMRVSENQIMLQCKRDANPQEQYNSTGKMDLKTAEARINNMSLLSLAQSPQGIGKRLISIGTHSVQERWRSHSRRLRHEHRVGLDLKEVSFSRLHFHSLGRSTRQRRSTVIKQIAN